MSLGINLWQAGALPTAIEVLASVRDTYTKLGNKEGVANAKYNLGGVFLELGVGPGSAGGLGAGTGPIPRSRRNSISGAAGRETCKVAG